MKLKNLNISTDPKDLKEAVMNPLMESSLKELISEYHSNKVRDIIAQNTDIFSVFHYMETKLINQINGIEYWCVRDITTLKSAVVNSNKEFIIPFNYYDYIENIDKDNKYIYCTQGNNKLRYDYNGNLVEGNLSEYISECREKAVAKNKYAELIVEAIKKPLLNMDSEHIYRLKTQISWCEENFKAVKQNTKILENSSIPHSIFDYKRTFFFTNNRNKRYFSLLQKNSEKWGLIDFKGDLITPFIYDDLGYFVSGEGEYIHTGIGGKYGLLDCLGNVAVKPIYDNVVLFYEGLASILQDKKWGYIDTSGNIVIPVIYDYATRFMFGKAKVTLNGEDFYINRKGERVE